MTILDAIAQADTLLQETAVEIIIPEKTPLIDYYIEGGAGYMSILTLFLIGVFIAAWKAPAWVRDLGFGAFMSSILFTFIAGYQMFGLIQQYADMPFAVACGGLRCISIPLIYGTFIYILAILISTFQKPRI